MISYPLLTILLVLGTAVSLLTGQVLGFTWGLFFGWWIGDTVRLLVGVFQDWRRPSREPWNDD